MQMQNSENLVFRSQPSIAFRLSFIYNTWLLSQFVASNPVASCFRIAFARQFFRLICLLIVTKSEDAIFITICAQFEACDAIARVSLTVVTWYFATQTTIGIRRMQTRRSNVYFFSFSANSIFYSTQLVTYDLLIARCVSDGAIRKMYLIYSWLTI